MVRNLAMRRSMRFTLGGVGEGGGRCKEKHNFMSSVKMLTKLKKIKQGRWRQASKGRRDR